MSSEPPTYEELRVAFDAISTSFLELNDTYVNHLTTSDELRAAFLVLSEANKKSSALISAQSEKIVALEAANAVLAATNAEQLDDIRELVQCFLHNTLNDKCGCMNERMKYANL
jgi:hypothetical protein